MTPMMPNRLTASPISTMIRRAVTLDVQSQAQHRNDEAKQRN